METSSKGKRLLTGEETVPTCHTSHTSPAFPARGFQAGCDGGPAIPLHRPKLCPRAGPRVECAGAVLTSNRELGSPPSWASPFPSPCKAQLQDSWLTVGIAGTKEHSGTCQASKGLLQPAQLNAPSLGAERVCLCQAHCWGFTATDPAHEPPLCSAGWVSGRPHLQMRKLRLREFWRLTEDNLARKRQS